MKDFSKRMKLCPSERFFDQPTATWCSGFLIAADKIVTAGHCIRSQQECKGISFVFGFNKKSAEETTTEFTADNVYRCQEIIHRHQDNFGADYAIVKIDRETTKTPLKMATELPQKTTELVVIGHTLGLPTKISAGAYMRESKSGFFVTNTDSYGGSSGSAVLDVQTGQVRGILVRGENDYVWQGKCRISKQCLDEGCRGEDATDIAEVIKKLSSL
jgi:V8-like Glu-specific endopeptidase